MGYYFEAKANSMIGSREKNEDSFYSSENILAISDGMGGHIAGEVASSTLIEFIKNHETSLSEIKCESAIKQLSDCIYMANGALSNKVETYKHLRGMGATLTLLVLIEGKELYIAHVGDSRCYRATRSVEKKEEGENHIEEKKLKIVQLTKDHTFAQSMFDCGIIDTPLNQADPRNSLLTHVLNGNNNMLNFDIFKADIRDRDYFLLTTDGFHNVLDETIALAKIKHHDTEENNVDKILNDLSDKLEHSVLNDNSTYIVAQLKTREITSNQ
jgi:protein phosphatase